MGQKIDSSGPVVIGEKVAVNRAHTHTCSTCPRWDQVKVEQGICRLRRPNMAVVGIGEGIDRSPRPVTYPIYDFTLAGDVCAFHPELLRAEVVDLFRHVFHAWETRLAWDREKGFNRAPGLDEARKFAVDPDKSA